MMAEHPNLYPKLKKFSIFHSFEPLIGSPAATQQFLEEIKLIPSSNSIPPKCCNLLMKVEHNKNTKLGWVWRCASRISQKKKKKNQVCRKTINPSKDTFFDGTHFRIAINDVLAIIICFILKMKVTEVIQNLAAWRRNNNGLGISNSTVIDYYSYCREIAEVISSNSTLKLGGTNKPVQIDETFLTKRKYNRGRITEQMTITVLGMYCKEDKTGLFFKVNSKSKADLWPYKKQYVDPTTTTICTDSAKQYCNVQNLFSEKCQHLTTNHSIGEYVDKNNSKNTINDLENQNKLLKKAIICRRSPKLIHQYMVLYFYRQNHLEKYKNDIGSQIMVFLEDIAKVYPPWIDGIKKENLFLKDIDPPTVDSQEIEHLLPQKNCNTQRSMN